MKEKEKTTKKFAKNGTKKAAARQEKQGKPAARRHYKDTVFRMLFSDKENLLSLYNAVNKTAYTDTENLEITTLENAIYTNYKNDVSFVFGFELILYEHQSTVNPNMPLRDLTYVTTVLQGMTREENLYGSEPVRIPSPKFAVFYNGTNPQPAQQILRLSDAFLKRQENPELELMVTVYNVNWGHNRELMEACRPLEEYSQYVSLVRQLSDEIPFGKAVETAVDYCIRNGILADFLSKNRAEVIAMSIFEYDEEKHMKSERETWRKKGREEGIAQGIQAVVETSKEFGDSKQETIERLMKKLKISMEKAQEGIEKYWH